MADRKYDAVQLSQGHIAQQVRSKATTGSLLGLELELGLSHAGARQSAEPV